MLSAFANFEMPFGTPRPGKHTACGVHGQRDVYSAVVYSVVPLPAPSLEHGHARSGLGCTFWHLQSLQYVLRACAHRIDHMRTCANMYKHENLII